MSQNTKTLTLASQAASLALRDLNKMATDGVMESHHSMFDLEVVAHGTRKTYRDSLFSMLPRSCTDRNSRCNFGVFNGLSLNEILPLVFAPEAIDFLVEHAYNPGIFWSNVNKCAFSMFREETEALPFSLETVKSRIIGENTPFGVRTSPYSNLNLARLKAHAAGGKFDANKLEAAYAFELIRHGFLLRQKLEDYQQPSILVVNPMWAHLLEPDAEAVAPEVAVLEDGSNSADATPQTEDGKLTSTAPGDSLVVAAVVENKRSTLVGYSQATGQITIEPAAGYTAAKIALMLSQRHCQIKGNEIVVNAIAPKTGHTVIATIVENEGTLRPSTPVWTVVS